MKKQNPPAAIPEIRPGQSIELLKELHRIVNEAIRAQTAVAETPPESKFYDLSNIDLEKLRDEFASKVRRKATALQDIREIVEQSTAAVEREVLTQVLRTTGGNKAKAARLLQIDYKTIHEKVKRLGILMDRANNGDNSMQEAKGNGTDAEPGGKSKRLKDSAGSDKDLGDLFESENSSFEVRKAT